MLGAGTITAGAQPTVLLMMEQHQLARFLKASPESTAILQVNSFA